MTTNIDTFIILTFFSYELFFIFRGIKRMDGFKVTNDLKEESLSTREYNAFLLSIQEPWRTKYRWGGVVQLSLVGLIIYF